MENVIFFGSNYLVLEEVIQAVNVNFVICEKKQINKELVTFCFMRKIKIKTVGNHEELNKIDVITTLGISCGFGIIFKNSFINKFNKGILNIHFGDLPLIRGRHPISWAFLNNLFEIGVTFHFVDEKIDVGILVHKYFVKRSLNNDQNDIEIKIFKKLLKNLKIAIKNVHEMKYTKMEEGVYYSNLAGKLDDIRSQDYDAIFLLNCVRSQKVFGGVVINGKKVDSCFLYDEEVDIGKGVIIESKDNIKLVVNQ